MSKIKEYYHDEIVKGQVFKATRWFRANNQADKLKGATVDAENGAIYGVSVCTVGEALGHGVSIEQSFIEDIVKFGNASKNGIKARFGHPNMSGESLGTYIGRFMNFRVEGQKAVADLYLAEAAKKSPNGDLYSYILEMSEKEPDQFGASIVFAVAENYFYTEGGVRENIERDSEGYIDNDNYQGQTIYVQMKALHGADLVDEPAANPDGLFSQFSSVNLHADKFAVIATEFLNVHPQIAAFVKDNPHKITEFMKKFAANTKPVDDTEVDETEVEPTTPTTGEVNPLETATEDELYSRIEARFSAQFKGFQKSIDTLTQRVKDLEENPNADPTYSAPKKDNQPGNPKPLRSWDVEYEKRYSKK